MTDETRSFQREDDPKDQRIKKLIAQHVFSGSVGNEMMQKSYDLQLQYYKDCLANLDNSDYIHDKNQQVLKDLAQATNSRIITGQELLADIPKGSPVFAMINHFSIYKLTSIEQSALGLNIDKSKLGTIPPPPMHFSSVYPVARALGDNLYDAHLELPDQLGVIQEASGFIRVTKKVHGQHKDVLEETKQHIGKYPDSVTVIFPEGQTSGKESERGPFDLEDFHGGAFGIAQQLGITVVPVAQYFNPNSGFELGVFKPISFEGAPSADDIEGRKAYFKGIANETHDQMQAWLDERKSP